MIKKSPNFYFLIVGGGKRGGGGVRNVPLHSMVNKFIPEQTERLPFYVPVSLAIKAPNTVGLIVE